MDPTDRNLIEAVFDARLQLATLRLHETELELARARAEIRRLRNQLKASSQAGMALLNGLLDEAEAEWDHSTAPRTPDYDVEAEPPANDA